MKRTTFFTTAAAVAMSIAAGQATLRIRSPDFYKGKDITILVGFGAGGGYDTTTRLFAR